MDRFIKAQIFGSKSLTLSEKIGDEAIKVSNQLNIEIENVSCVKNITFINNLNEGEPIPDIGVDQEDITVIYVFFPLGEGEAYLTTNDLANDFVCYAPYNWNVQKAFDQEHYGVYFKFFPTSEYAFEPREKMYFSISNMVSYGSLEKMVYVAVNFTSVFIDEELSSNGTDYLPCFKKRRPLEVLSFEASPSKVAVGDEITLNWVVAGDAVKCILTPGDIEVEKIGRMDTCVDMDTEFMIYALGKDSQVSKNAMVYIETPVIHAFTCDVPDKKIKYGDWVSFNYEVENCKSIFMNQGIGRVKSKPINVVPSQKLTDYTLICKSTNGLIQKSITIEITNFLEVKNVTYYRNKKSDGTYQYTLIWLILNSTSSKIITSDGVVRSQDQKSGSINFSDASVTPLKVRLICTGEGGQKLDSEYDV